MALNFLGRPARRAADAARATAVAEPTHVP